MPGRLTEEAREKVIAALRAGAHPQVACLAAGLGRSYYSDVRYRAKKGDQAAQELLEVFEAAAAQGELVDVEATTRAVEPLNEQPIVCPMCEHEFSADAEQLAHWVAKLTDVAKAKAAAADIALKKLERRHPKRWSQKVIHTVQEEHERLLDVCQRVLAPEVFESLLEEYLAGECGEGETADGQSGSSTGGVH